MISTRFGLILCITLIVAIVPTFIHTYIGAVADDKLRVEAVSTNLVGLDSTPTDRRAAWVKDTFDSHDWIERRYSGPDNENILLFIARSYDLKRLYHHPEIGILRGVDLEKGDVENLNEMTDVPVHVLKSRSGNKVLAAYVLLYNGQFVENPMWLQILTSFELLYGPRKPMTLFMVYDSNAGHENRLEQWLAARVLESAIESFLAQENESSQ